MANILSMAEARNIARKYINKDSTLTETQVISLSEYLALEQYKSDLWENVQMGYNAVPLGFGADYYNNMIYNAAINAGIYQLDTTKTIKTPLSKTYSFFDYTNDVVLSQGTTTSGIFPGSVGTLSTFYTSSAQSAASKEYYLTIANGSGSGDTALFDVVHLVTGSILSASENVMYKEFANILLSGSSSKFVVNSSDQTDLYVVSFKRSIIKEQLDPGNFEFIHSGKHYIDDSDDNNGTVGPIGKVYNIVSGSIDNGAYNATPVGLFYPITGTVLFVTSDLSGSNTTNVEFFENISSIKARNSQVLKESNYFCRLKNKEYNYSNNPTFLSSSNTGEFIYATFKNDPKVFPTTVGLYNDNNELLATAKLSKPFKKAFDTEMVVKVKLSF